MTIQDLATVVVALNFNDQNVFTIVDVWHKVVSDLREIYPNMTEGEFNKHPINIVLAYKLSRITEANDYRTYIDAHEKVVNLQY